MALTVAGLTALFAGAVPQPVERPPADSGQNPVALMADAWKGAVSYAPSYDALDPAQTTAALAEATGFNATDDYGGLPRSDGHETVAAYCASCHTLQIVMAQRQTREGWEELLALMTGEHGMAPPPAEVRSEIVDYLTREFGR